MPGLQQLLGQRLQLGRIGSGINRPGKAFHFKQLTNGQLLGARHDDTSEQRTNAIGGRLFLGSEHYASAACGQINSERDNSIRLINWSDQPL